MFGIDVGTWVIIGYAVCGLTLAVAVVLIMRGITGHW